VLSSIVAILYKSRVIQTRFITKKVKIPPPDSIPNWVAIYTEIINIITTYIRHPVIYILLSYSILISEKYYYISLPL